MYAEATGLLAIAVGVYALRNPANVRSFPSGDEWREDPDRAAQEQRAFATLTAATLVVGGLVLLGLGLLGRAP
jgi:hypothetical protein